MEITSAWGTGLATIASDSQTLDVWYPRPRLGPAQYEEDADILEQLGQAEGFDQNRTVTQSVVRVAVDLQSSPASTADAYLRLHLLSHRLVPPNSINLEGIFARLSNVVWTNFGPCAVDNFEATRLRWRTLSDPGPALQVLRVDKFPNMIDYVVPSGVRIANGARVRLGAYLAPGTTVMPAGFVNFNAGTLGQSMVEGRISQGVVVGEGSDIGGGASTMGTLSGGGATRVSLGKRCLLGANSGVGIALGDDCVVEAGLYLTAGTKVAVVESGGIRPGLGGALMEPQIVSARELSGAANVLYRRNSLSGRVEALGRTGAGISLNTDLHVN